MNIRITKKDIIWSYLSYALKVGSNIVVLPFIFKYLDKRELGLWYVFVAIGSFVLLLDLGFSSTIMRSFSYSWAGANDICKKGYTIVNKEQQPNYKLLFELIKTSKFIYFTISVIALILMLTIGSIYIKSICKDMLNDDIMIAWYIYSIGIYLNLYFSYWNPLLIAIGKITEAQKAVVFSQLAYIILILIGFRCRLNLIAVSIAYLLMGVLLRILSKYYFKNIKEIELHKHLNQSKIKDILHYVNIMWYNAKRAGLVSIGVYMENNINTLIASTFIGLEQTGAYGLTMQIFTAIRAFSSTSIRMYTPLFGNLRVKNEKETIKKVFAKILICSWSLFFICTIMILFLGKYLLVLMGKEAVLPSNLYLTIMAICSFLAFNHGDIFATFITTKNEVPFTKTTIITGSAVVILSYVFVRFFNMGIWGLLLSSSIAQICYNNWKWPLVVLKEFEISMYQLVSEGVKEIYVYIKKLL